MVNSFSPEPETRSSPQVWNWKDVALIGFGAVVIFIVGFAALTILLRSLQDGLDLGVGPTMLMSAGLGLLEGVALIGSVYLLGLRRRRFDWSAVGINPPRRGWMTTAVLLGLVVIPLSGLIAYGIQLALGRAPENPQLPFLAPEGFSWFGAISMLVFGGLVGPFAEELLFRGVIYTWLRDRWNVWLANLASSLLFGILHGEVSVAGAAFVLGIILAWSYERSRSLWPPVLIHVLNNSAKIVLLYIMLATGDIPSPVLPAAILTAVKSLFF